MALVCRSSNRPSGPADWAAGPSEGPSARFRRGGPVFFCGQYL